MNGLLEETMSQIRRECYHVEYVLRLLEKNCNHINLESGIKNNMQNSFWIEDEENFIIVET